MPDLLDQTRSGIDNRLKELRPLYDEYLKLERAKAALQGIEAPRRGPGRPRGSTGAGASSASGTARKRGRRRRGGTRAEQALEMVRQNPGIGVPDLAERIGIKQKNYLYRVMSELASGGAVKKEGRGYVAK